MRAGLSVLPLFAFAWLQGGVFAQSTVTAAGDLKLDTGKEIYRAACVSYHGADGRGEAQTTVGFETPLPDFSDCNFSTREPVADWMAVVHGGGPVRAFSEIMPSFSEALTLEQIEKVANYVHGFCGDRSWPRGELNLPRALVTEKAFPEDEAVLTTSINTTGASAVENVIVYEKRFGARNQMEFVVPFSFQRQNTGTWFGGVGDVALGYKRLLAHSLESGSIFSVAGEVILPTGNEDRGFGKGVTVFEGFASYGQILPADFFAQFQGGIETPTHKDDASNAAFWRAVIGRTMSEDQGFGRAWSPMVEFLAERDFATGASVNWDIVPQMQVTLSKRQHIMANFGVRIPLTNTASRSTAVVFYLLWDQFDGGVFEGWK